MGRKKGNKNGKEISKRNDHESRAKRIPGFVLREDVDSPQNSGPERVEDLQKVSRDRYGTDIDLLMSMFGDLGLEVVSVVLDNHEGNLQAAWSFLEYLGETNASEGQANDKTNEDDPGKDAPTSCDERDSHGGDAESTQSLWDTLPEDCKRIIWGFLPVTDRHRAAATSREWYQYSIESISWHSFVSVNRNMRLDSVRRMICSHRLSDKIKFDYRDHAVGNVLWKDPGEFYKMVRLGEDDRMTYGDPDTADINTVMVHGSEAFDSDELGCLLENLKYMKHLHLYNCPQIGDDDVEALARYRGKIWRTDDLFEDLDNYNTLHSLSMHGTKLTKNGLGKLLNNYMYMCRDLTVLDVSGSKSLTGLEPPIYAKLLRTLTAKNCPSISRVDLKIPKSSFRKLELQSCRNLKEVCLDTRSDGGLKHLNVSSCKQLQTLSLHCPKLQTLQAAACWQLKLTGPYISALNVPNLEHLNINGCREVDDEGLSLLLRKISRGLKTLNIGGCIRLTDVSVTFQAVEGCVLDSYGCPKLKSLQVQSPLPLEKLVVSGCRRLATVTVFGREPVSFYSDQCESLRGINH